MTRINLTIDPWRLNKYGSDEKVILITDKIDRTPRKLISTISTIGGNIEVWANERFEGIEVVIQD